MLSPPKAKLPQKHSWLDLIRFFFSSLLWAVLGNAQYMMVCLVQKHYAFVFTRGTIDIAVGEKPSIEMNLCCYTTATGGGGG